MSIQIFEENNIYNKPSINVTIMIDTDNGEVEEIDISTTQITFPIKKNKVEEESDTEAETEDEDDTEVEEMDISTTQKTFPIKTKVEDESEYESEYEDESDSEDEDMDIIDDIDAFYSDYYGDYDYLEQGNGYEDEFYECIDL